MTHQHPVEGIKSRKIVPKLLGKSTPKGYILLVPKKGAPRRLYVKAISCFLIDVKDFLSLLTHNTDSFNISDCGNNCLYKWKVKLILALNKT